MKNDNVSAPVSPASGRSRTCIGKAEEKGAGAALRAAGTTKRASARRTEAVAAGGGDAADLLDNKENKSTASGEPEVSAQELVWRMRAMEWRMSSLRSARACGRVLRGEEARGDGFVSVRLFDRSDGSCGAALGNLVACKSKSCPRCAGVVAHERARQLAQGLRWWLEYPKEGEHRPMRGALFITFTVQHSLDDDAQTLIDVLSRARTALTAGASYRGGKRYIGDRARFGIAGWVHTIENTWNPVNGHHIHLHSIVLLQRIPTVEEYQQLVVRLYSRWEKSLEKDGYHCDVNKGYSVELVKEANDAALRLADYVTKDTAERAAFELANGQGKHGRNGSMTMFQILAELALDDNLRRFWFPLDGSEIVRWVDDNLLVVNAVSGEIRREYPVKGRLRLLKVIHESEQALKRRGLMTFSKRVKEPSGDLDELWNEFLDRTHSEDVTDDQIADRRDMHSFLLYKIDRYRWYANYVKKPENIFALIASRNIPASRRSHITAEDVLGLSDAASSSTESH